jgi:hypothetical protein
VSLHVTRWMTLGNWFSPLRLRQILAAAVTLETQVDHRASVAPPGLNIDAFCQRFRHTGCPRTSPQPWIPQTNSLSARSIRAEWLHGLRHAARNDRTA